MGEMSSIVSRRPSLRNQSNDAFWMSIRFGSSRTSLMREKDVRARGAATLAVKRYSLPYYSEESEISDRRKRRNVTRTCKGTQRRGSTARRAPRRPRSGANRSADRNKAEDPRARETTLGRRTAARRRPFQTVTRRELLDLD